MSKINITKASGEKQLFSEQKLRRSLQNAGAGKVQIDAIIEDLLPQLHEGISTKTIYRLAFKLLKNESSHIAARYHLKKAILELGPSGFPFEKYIAAILEQQGYKTKTGQFIEGKCVTHEIDVLAEKDDSFHMIECKYHNLQGSICDVKIPLYIKSRFDDVKSKWLIMPDHKDKRHYGWLVTNTRFTSDATRYGACAGLQLLSWDYPAGESLKMQIDRSGLYPITCLTSLINVEKQNLLDKNIVLCKEIKNDEKLLAAIGVKQSRIYTVIKEVQLLCNNL